MSKREIIGIDGVQFTRHSGTWNWRMPPVSRLNDPLWQTCTNENSVVLKELITLKSRLADAERDVQDSKELFQTYVNLSKKKLQSARAENGRLFEALFPAIATHGEVCNTPSCQIKHIGNKALSTSNALDYWQGEIRRAEDKIWDRVIKAILDGRFLHERAKPKLFADEVCEMLGRLRKSNE